MFKVFRNRTADTSPTYTIDDAIRDELRSLTLLHGVTTERLLEEAGVSSDALDGDISGRDLQPICRVLDISIDDLIRNAESFRYRG